jgi:pyrimidine deaminase RibD-like protein
MEVEAKMHRAYVSMSASSSATAIIHLALAEARKCESSPTAFSVGCVLAVAPADDSEPIILSTGYSRELPGNTHAEANALAKLNALTPSQLQSLFPGNTPPRIDEILARVDVYTTMEPCSVRTSGLAPCADGLIAAGVRRCFIGVGEPPDFVKCEGAQKLKDAGIEVIWVAGLEEECLEVARRGHHT